MRGWCMIVALPQWLFFDSAGEDVVGKLLRSRRRQETDASGSGELRCVYCNHLITRTDYRTEIHGNHEHQRTNPYGFTFRLGCFSAAPGCTLAGEPTAGDTWFVGYRWRIALCGGCQEHMGWGFAGAGPDFYGLVLDYLREQR